MRRLAFLCLLLVSAVVPARANHGPEVFVQTGTILVGNPGTRTIGGVTELVSPCNGSLDPDVPAGIAQGIDGFWFALPEGAEGHRATLTAPVVDGVVIGIGDVDAWFYDEGCALVRPPGGTTSGPTDENAYHMATVGSREFGIVPLPARFVAVDLVEGANVEFTFTVYDLPA